MPKFHPTPLIQDCWSSIGNITFYHRNGQCYFKRKAQTPFVGSPAQLDQAQVHHRAILAWQQLQHSVQLEWRELAKSVPSHRPPYDSNHHISGYNLFISAYHGFAQIGCEHVPAPTRERRYSERGRCRTLGAGNPGPRKLMITGRLKRRCIWQSVESRCTSSIHPKKNLFINLSDKREVAA